MELHVVTMSFSVKVEYQNSQIAENFMMYLYKAANGLMTVPDGIVVPRLCAHNTRLSSQVTFVQPFARTNTYHHSFFPSIISLWNSLPKSVITVPSAMSFKHNLSSYISNNN